MKLVFLHSSDTHGYLLPTDYQNDGEYNAPFGLSRVASAIKAEKAKWGAEHVVVTDAGDCLQGSPLAAYAHGSGDLKNLDRFTAAYNAVGYDVRCLGNHDFNFGQSYMANYVDNNQAPFVNCNILDAETHMPALGREYVILERSGVKIGVIGITTQYIPHWEAADRIKGLEFKSAFEQVNKLAKKLKPRVDVLAVLYHGGFESDIEDGHATEPHNGENEGYRILTEIPEVDVMLTGHQHRRLNVIKDGKPCVQPGYRGEAIAEVVLDLDKTEDGYKVKSAESTLIDTKDYDSDPELAQIVQPLDQATQKWLDQPIVHLDEPAPIEDANKGRIEGAPFINLLQQMQLYFTGADLSATAVMNDVAKGFGKTVTMRDICYIFYAMGVGLATGMGYIGFAALLTVIVGLVLAALSYIPFFSVKNTMRELRIVIPEDLDYTDCFKDIFEEYLTSVKLLHAKTTAMGTLYDLRYEVVLKNPDKEKELLDKIRVRNGNLTVACSIPAIAKDEL